MKKILLISLIATTLLSGFAVYADGGKKTSKKKAHPRERVKQKCPNRPGCICK